MPDNFRAAVPYIGTLEDELTAARAENAMLRLELEEAKRKIHNLEIDVEVGNKVIEAAIWSNTKQR